MRWRESNELPGAFGIFRGAIDKHSNLGANVVWFCYLLGLLGAFLHPVCELAHLLRGLGGVSLGVCLACHCCSLLLTGLMVALFRGLYLPKCNRTLVSLFKLYVFLPKKRTV